METVRLPFDSNGVEIEIPQGPDTNSSHQSYLAISWDFNLDFGHEVLAIADGKIIDIRETVPDGVYLTATGEESTASRAWKGEAMHADNLDSLGSGGTGNIVTIEHTDKDNKKYYSTYMHLQQNSIPVSVDDNVIAGQVIGLVGNTGFRSDTHLHLSVGKTKQESYGSTKYGKWTSGENFDPVTIADAHSNEVNKALIKFADYEDDGIDLPSLVIGKTNNHLPIATQDTNAQYSVLKDGSLLFNSENLLKNDTDMDGDKLHIEIVDEDGFGADKNNDGQPDWVGNGTAHLHENKNSIIFKPNKNATEGTFAYAANDGRSYDNSWTLVSFKIDLDSAINTNGFDEFRANGNIIAVTSVPEGAPIYNISSAYAEMIALEGGGLVLVWMETNNLLKTNHIKVRFYDNDGQITEVDQSYNLEYSKDWAQLHFNPRFHLVENSDGSVNIQYVDSFTTQFVPNRQLVFNSKHELTGDEKLDDFVPTSAAILSLSENHYFSFFSNYNTEGPLPITTITFGEVIDKSQVRLPLKIAEMIGSIENHNFFELAIREMYDGRYLLFWSERHLNVKTTSQAKFYDPNTGSLTEQFEIPIPSTNADATESDIIGLKDNGFLLISKEQDEHIIAIRFNENGEQVGDVLNISHINKDNDKDINPAVVQLSNGDIAIAWTSYNYAENDSFVEDQGVNVFLQTISNENIKEVKLTTTSTDTNFPTLSFLPKDGDVKNEIQTFTGDDAANNMISFKHLADIDGGAGSDFIRGGIFGDTLSGGEGNDILRGDASDNIYGASDSLQGGRGNDVLMGGQGRDTFIFNPIDGKDIIGAFSVADVQFDETLGFTVKVSSVDFTSGIDVIHLIGFKGLDQTNIMEFVTDTTDGAVFTNFGTSISFYDVEVAQLSATDFMFS